VIEVGERLSVVENAFGEDCCLDMGETCREGTYAAIVYFDEVVRPPSHDEGDIPVQVGQEGWYLYVEYSEKRYITDYYLSNIHK
jgi:hypothetical protein